jgi:hypothetical protein
MTTLMGEIADGPASRAVRVAIVAALLVAGAGSGALVGVRAQDTPIAATEFELVWQRTEAPVADGSSQRSWLWGPGPRTDGLLERYLDAHDNERLVQYFDKGRMEINDLTADPVDPWYVTSGLLTRELISGRIQIGDDDFLDTGAGAAIHFAGDPHPEFPHYAHLADVVDRGQPDRRGQEVDRVLERTAQNMERVELGTIPVHAGDPNIEYVHYVTYHGPAGVDVGYNIPRAFWGYMNQSGVVVGSSGHLEVADPLYQWIYVLGFPIADPFWVEVPVNGVTQWVMVQLFERRVLTYTPNNPSAWQVEMGNIGQHYQIWRGSFTSPGGIDGDLDYFGLVTGEMWRYGTTEGVDELWRVVGESHSFVPGSTVISREELTIQGRRMTYWSVTERGLLFHGWEILDGQGNVRDLTLYTPPIRVLPYKVSHDTLRTETTVLSKFYPPETVTVTMRVELLQLVSTPAGIFQSWRTEGEASDGADPRHGLGVRFWFADEIGIIQWMDTGFAAHLRTSSRLDN